ncbi:DUF5702 domain-containing protein [Paenibacillus albus]|uniref:Uncharacterized protein n=1 Tax=Paenibacillus albus TaxID=2495582 RepID=A0A3Q8X418_9BACL|nr:DUF5702 domain-containing protein [Paenibacillus albus]AZN39941.1 hypothetical protein EJC50_09980 [Paenibacillus albus]
MTRFWRDCKGAVTVFVTLLLIPAVLISGTAVDLARIYTVRSVVQDANQLAANSVLAGYDAMLQDIYGLYGFMKVDPAFGDMVDEYIRVAVLGEGSNAKTEAKGGGTFQPFQLFYGSKDMTSEVRVPQNKNLNNPEVLRRQIEEYAKFRAPVIIAERISTILDSFKKVKEDAEIIKDKMDIDDRIEEIEKQYQAIYNKINEINAGSSMGSSAIASINTYLGRIQEQISLLLNTRDDWMNANKEPEKAADLEAKYDDIMSNIKSLVNGGTVKDGWMNGNFNASEEWESGYWTGSHRSDGIKEAIGDQTKALEEFKKKFDELVSLCSDADTKKQELSQKVSDLETKLKSGRGSSELKAGLTTPPKDKNGKTLKDSKGQNMPSTIDRYKKLLAYSLKPMAVEMKKVDGTYIDSIIATLSKIQFGKVSNNIIGDPHIQLDKLTQLSSDSRFSISFYENSIDDKHAPGDYLYQLAQVTNYTYSAPNGFKRFEDISTSNAKFYKLLNEMFSSTGGNNTAKKKAKSAITTLMAKVQDLFQGYELNPEGAYKYNPKPNNNSADTSFVSDGDWGEEGVGKSKTKEALNSDIISNVGDMASNAANKILLLVYDTEMFSNYTTTSTLVNSSEGSREEPVKTMSGIPLGVDVNYYFQSEQEYLFHGNFNDAKANLASVAGMLFLVRFVFDYTAAFTITEVNTTVSEIEAAVAFTGPFAIVIGEAARVAIAMAEATIDVGRLRKGHAVALWKTNSNWQFKVSGLLKAVKDSAQDAAADLKDDSSKDDKPGLLYSDYLRLFLLMIDGDELADRTASLIALNLTNKKQQVGSAGNRAAREKKMAGLTLENMEKYQTDFQLTTTVDMRMLFLSMPFAQRGVKGVVPPKTKEIIVTDYRGY